MELLMAGLGRMGGSMARRLHKGGHRVVAFDVDEAARERARGEGLETAPTLAEAVARLQRAPRVAWLMLPAGQATEGAMEELAHLLAPGDVVVDGGNANHRETAERAERLAARGLHLVDAGTSGGIWGYENGYCLMVGGTAEAVRAVEPALATLAPPGGYLHVGPPGAGHFVKMVHNGIEYGMLQAYAEGFELLHAARHYPGLDLGAIARLWNRGSVVRSWLLELAADAFERDPDLSALRGYVEDTGEGRWTVAEAIDADVPAPVITLSLLMRLRSRQDDSFAARVVAALRQEFGGHAVRGR
ncbi:MAG: decarboxylating 6-phosphogluconate dehydrogenase [Firmicutes bacterium]|nr:decarboxylating 6-phosphogluconate dehydrogenase [Bacillota bacterium]